MISLTNLNAMRSAAAMADSDADIKTSMERLSTGSRINSASDDAAGSAIATRMNTQVIGMAKAIDNAFDGANLMSTADGALDEVHSLLQRMRELAVQSANGTQTDYDRSALNSEYQMMSAEISRIGTNTEWNGKKIFDGLGFPGETKFQVGADAAQTINVVIDELTTSKLGKGIGGALVAHPATPPSAVTTQDSYTSHSGTAPSVQTTAGVRASLGSDIDGDGDPDVITIDNYSGSFYVYKNDGNGDDGDGPIFDNGTAVSIGSQADKAVDIALGDLDGDGDTDVVTRNDKGANFKIFTNNGSGSFTAGATVNTTSTPDNFVRIETVDLDGDGDLDIVTRDDQTAAIETFINNGSGSFSAGAVISMPAAATNHVALTTGDFDGDGDQDIVTRRNSDSALIKYLNDGSGNFTESGRANPTYLSNTSSTTAVDIDGDGDLDIAVLNEVNVNDGSGVFSRGGMIPAYQGQTSISFRSFTFADLDGDGDEDIIDRIVASSQGPFERLETQFNDGSGNFPVGSNLTQQLTTPNTFSGQALGARSIVASSPDSAIAASSTIDFSGLSLSLGDRVTITVPGGTNVSAVMDANGLNTLLTSLGNSLAAQSSLFSGASNSGGTLTINGLADGSAMPSLSVTLEDGVDTSRFDFNNKNLVEGDQVVIKVTGGTDVQGTIDSNGLDTLLGTLATQLQSQSSLFSNASVSSGVLSLTGLSNGSAIAGVTVEMSTSASQIENTSIGTQTNTSVALGSLDKAIQDVSFMRSKYGATLNQLFAAVNNLTTVSANLSSSKSTVEDADYAEESSNLASAQIRNQSAKAMLAQVNTDQELIFKLIEDSL